jgi:hypothetical protein
MKVRPLMTEEGEADLTAWKKPSGTQQRKMRE